MCERMRADRVSSDGRWEIRWVCIKDTGSYFESDVRWEARVIDRASKVIVLSFVRNEFANANGSVDSGVSDVEFSSGRATVRATYEDGRVEDVALER
jgi:hypothetical protein